MIFSSERADVREADYAVALEPACIDGFLRSVSDADEEAAGWIS